MLSKGGLASSDMSPTASSSTRFGGHYDTSRLKAYFSLAASYPSRLGARAHIRAAPRHASMEGASSRLCRRSQHHDRLRQQDSTTGCTFRCPNTSFSNIKCRHRRPTLRSTSRASPSSSESPFSSLPSHCLHQLSRLDPLRPSCCCCCCGRCCRGHSHSAIVFI